MKHKPFDLEAALAGAPVRTRDGRKVFNLTHFSTLVDTSHTVFGHIEGAGGISGFKIDGRFWGAYDSDFDLFMESKEKTVWVNFYPTATLQVRGECHYYETEAIADSWAAPYRIGGKAVEVTIYE